jgi:hypothetical protein
MPAEQAHAPFHGHETETPVALRAPPRTCHVEAPTVVGHGEMQESPTPAQGDAHLCGPAVLPNVGERFLDHPSYCDALRVRYSLDVAFNRESGIHPRPAPEVGHGLLQRLLKRSSVSAGRRGDLAQVIVQLGCDRPQIRNTLPRDAAGAFLGQEVLELPLENGQLADEERQVLKRAVVDVEAEPRDATIGCLQKLLGSCLRVFEQ